MPFDSTDHYENFPVGSILLPLRLRKPVSVIYRFARSADDIADEGDADSATRLRHLEEYRRELDRIEQEQQPQSPLFRDLADIVRRYRLPLAPLRDLLSAFSQDVVKTRYANFSELMDYCNRSANPVGRLLLYLFGRTADQEVAWSDAICSSLQLINFWQDIAIDWQKGRVYLPLDDMAGHGVDESHIARGHVDARWLRLMAFQIARSRTMLESGAQLGRVLPGRIGLEIRTIIAGGRTIVGKLEASGGDVFRHRPRLRLRDWPAIVSYAFFARP